MTSPESIQTINGSNYYVSTLTHDGGMEYIGLTVRNKRLLALLCTHDKSTLPCDVWMDFFLFFEKNYFILKRDFTLLKF